MLKSIKYILIYLFALHLLIPYAFALDDVYNERLDYEVVKNNTYDIHPVLQQIKLDLHGTEEPPIIVLGDSVLYGSPGPSAEAPTVRLRELAAEAAAAAGQTAPRVYNLAFPAMQLGDMYTMLLLLEDYGIPTDRIVMNVRYGSFIERNPYPPSVFWLKDELHRLDGEAFRHIEEQLRDTGYRSNHTPGRVANDWLRQHALARFSPTAYRDYAYRNLVRLRDKLCGDPIGTDALGDPRSWRDKGDLGYILEDPQFTSAFAPEPFEWSAEANPDFYFLDRIVRHQRGKTTLIALTGANRAFAHKFVTAPGYLDNLEQLDRRLDALPVGFVNLDGKIDDDLFTDHTHYTAEGNRRVAELIWRTWTSLAPPLPQEE